MLSIVTMCDVRVAKLKQPSFALNFVPDSTVLSLFTSETEKGLNLKTNTCLSGDLCKYNLTFTFSPCSESSIGSSMYRFLVVIQKFDKAIYLKWVLNY